MNLFDLAFIVVGMASTFALGVLVGIDHAETKAVLEDAETQPAEEGTG